MTIAFAVLFLQNIYGIHFYLHQVTHLPVRLTNNRVSPEVIFNGNWNITSTPYIGDKVESEKTDQRCCVVLCSAV